MSSSLDFTATLHTERGVQPLASGTVTSGASDNCPVAIQSCRLTSAPRVVFLDGAPKNGKEERRFIPNSRCGASAPQKTRMKIIMSRKIMSGQTGRFLLVALLLLVLWACSLGPAAGSVGDRAGAVAGGIHSSAVSSKVAAASWTSSHLPVRPTLTEIANSYIDNMTLDQELGQLFIGALTDNDYNANNAGMVEQQGVVSEPPD